MKLLPVLIFTLMPILSGCSSTPTLEEQSRLIEYENCIQNVTRMISDVRKSVAETQKFPEKIEYIGEPLTSFSKYFREAVLEKCSDFRP